MLESTQNMQQLIESIFRLIAIQPRDFSEAVEWGDSQILKLRYIIRRDRYSCKIMRLPGLTLL